MSTSKAKSRIQLPIDGSRETIWLTTGQVAARLGVASKTIAKWIDSGRMLGVRLPDSKDRRVSLDALLAFERDNGFDRARGKP
jgi:excisionase family DNA binding protein